jgi:hypothetical protein
MKPDEFELPPVATKAQIYDRVVKDVELIKWMIKKDMFHKLSKEDQLKMLYDVSTGLIPLYHLISREEE